MPNRTFTPTPTETAIADLTRTYWNIATSPSTTLMMVPMMPLTMGIFVMMNGYMMGRSLMGQ